VKKVLCWVFTAVFFVTLFSYKLTQVPAGITVDEAAFGYNGVLLSKTLHDENGRFMPIFVLSLNGQDWRQPVTQYFTALIFKILGPSLFNLRMTAVIFAVVSVFLIYILGRKILGNIGGIFTAVFFVTTPVIMIHSHLGLDNIAPVPFVIIWLLTLFLFEKSKRNYWLLLSAISLGIGYYSYKGMRVFVPTWVILTIFYLAADFLRKFSRKNFVAVIRPISFFVISTVPFFAIIPLLEHFYAGAVLGGQHPVYEGIYKFLYPYLSMFDPSFLFIKGDEFLFHTTGTHGMYLLASLPFFILGLTFTWKKSSFWKLIIASFFLGPLLFGLFGSIHRASRMLAEVPLYSLICAGGFLYLWQGRRKWILGILALVFAFNYFDFVKYYWGNYAKDTANIYYCFSCAESQYKTLKEESAKRSLMPYVDEIIAKREDATADFARAIYYLTPPKLWDGRMENFPKNGILMTDNDNLVNLKQIDHVGNLFYYVH
jgi:hypothetical protein